MNGTIRKSSIIMKIIAALFAAFPIPFLFATSPTFIGVCQGTISCDNINTIIGLFSDMSNLSFLALSIMIVMAALGKVESSIGKLRIGMCFLALSNLFWIVYAILDAVFIGSYTVLFLVIAISFSLFLLCAGTAAATSFAIHKKITGFNLNLSFICAAAYVILSILEALIDPYEVSDAANTILVFMFECPPVALFLFAWSLKE